MTAYFRFMIVLSTATMWLLAACDSEHCGYSRVSNTTGYDVHLKVYDADRTIRNFYLGSQKTTYFKERCRIGKGKYPAFSFFGYQDRRYPDSLDIIFHGTKFLRFYLKVMPCVERNPLSDGCYTEVPEMDNHYQFSITQDDYLKAKDMK